LKIVQLTWLASYPRSGNTWLRFLLANALFGEVRHSLEVERRIPNLHRRGALAAPEGSLLLCKTHSLFSDHHPYCERTHACIYLLRSPKDVLISNYHYLAMAGHIPPDPRAFAEDFIRHQGVPLWRSAGVGSWMEHVRSWLWSPRVPVLVLRYEQMARSPRETLARAVRFLGVDAGEERIAAAVEASSFDRMRELEEREKRAGGPTLFTARAPAGREAFSFVRKGESGQSLHALGCDLDEEFDTVFKPFLDEIEDRLRALNQAS
jgi:aryl sulfotransferase